MEGGIEEVRRLQDMIRVIRGHREVGILNQVMDEHDEVPKEVGFQGNQRDRLVGSFEGKQTVMASYWRVSSSLIKKSSTEVREW